MQLQSGQAAPAFNHVDIFGERHSLARYRGKKLLLSFYRYASCPLCNLRVHQLIQLHPQLQAQGLEMLAVFQSPDAQICQYVGRQDAPFALLADPQQQLYRRYGVSPSWWKLAKAAARLGAVIKSFRLGFWPGKIDGALAMVPADFLIDEQGNIARAYYGADIGDHLPVAEIFAWLEAVKEDITQVYSN